MKTALFVDFDNVFSGLRKFSSESAERFAKNPLIWLEWLANDVPRTNAISHSREARRILVRRCYFNPVMYAAYRRPFQEAGFEIVDCPPMTATGKTSTDIHLVLDTIDALQDETHFDEFVIFSADADFSPVLRRLRRQDRRTVIFAAGAMSWTYRASADVVIDFQAFVQMGLGFGVEDSGSIGSPQRTNDEEGLRDKISNRIFEIVVDASEPVPFSHLAGRLQSFRDSLSGGWLGASSFGALLKSLTVDRVFFDSQAELAFDQHRLKRAQVQSSEPPGPTILPQVSGNPQSRQNAAPFRPIEKMTHTSFSESASSFILELVSSSSKPIPLSALSQKLKGNFPDIGGDWDGAQTLSAFLDRLQISPIRRAALDDGSTQVLYNPEKHEPPGAEGLTPTMAALLRSAEMPAMSAKSLLTILEHLYRHLGGSEAMDIISISHRVRDDLTAAGKQLPLNRIAMILKGLTYNGLDIEKKYLTLTSIKVDVAGILIAAWSRINQVSIDKATQIELVDWLQLASEDSGTNSAIC